MTRTQGVVGMLLGTVFLAGGLLPVRAEAQPESPVSRTITVPLHKSKVIKVREPVKKISIGSPKVADILILRSQEVYIVGKELGSTNVVLWNRSGRVVGTIDIEVSLDLETLKTKLHELLPDEAIQVRSAHGSIVLSGEVSSAPRMEAAVNLAHSFLVSEGGKKSGAKVLNMLQVGGSQQVMLQVQVAELSRSLIKRLGINFNAITTHGHISIGAVNGGGSLVSNAFQGEGANIASGTTDIGAKTLSAADKGLLASFLDGKTLINMVIEAAQQDGLAKVLAEPTLTTLTGQQATFQSGGQFPIPKDNGSNNGTTIEFKDFGIALKFLPVVLDSGNISLKVNILVSELSDENSVVVGVPNTSSFFVVPSLTTRGASSTVELGNGQTIGIAGLIDESLRENVSRFPGLGDIPVLGALFRSQEFIKGQTELVILVTPTFAKPIDHSAVSLPTDSFVEPSSAEFYLLGRLAGKKAHAPLPGADKGGAEGRFGHEI